MSDKFNIDGEAIRRLADILVETDLTEIEYEDDGCRIRVAKNGVPVTSHAVVAPASAAQPSPQLSAVPAQDAPVAAPVDPGAHPGAVKAPMVGTAYLAQEPGAAPFVKKGDKVSAGQPLLIIEAMKVMNQIKAEKAGTIKDVLIQDASPVEFGEPLLIIE